MEPVNIGIAGLGTVGSGTVNVLNRNADEIARRAGRHINISIAAVRDITKPRDFETTGFKLTEDCLEVANDPDVQVVVELIGGDTLARELVLTAISNRKHVVTANKALIAVHGNEIFASAQEHGVMVAFESAVAGGIPIIKTIREGLAANRIQSLSGIVNGTSNYILSAMRDTGRSFQSMLSEAQELGYAEADPTFDIEGIDAAHKLTILASIAFGIPLNFKGVHTEGISSLSLEDIHYAEDLGFRIKHLGIAVRREDGIEMRVHPTLVHEDMLMASVNGVMNAIEVHGDAVGTTLHCGPGAGSAATASAVVADLVDVVRVLTTDPDNRVPHLAFQPDAIASLNILSIEDCTSAYYLRMKAVNKPGVLASVTRIFGDLGISIETMLQKGSGEHLDHVPIIILTQSTRERNILNAIEQIESLDTVVDPLVKIRVGSS